MKTLRDIRQILDEHRERLSADYKVSRLGVFGSFARGEQHDGSDVDIWVEFREPVGFEFIHLADSLENLLGLPVDLVASDGVKPNRWRYIQEDLMYVQARLETVRRGPPGKHRPD